MKTSELKKIASDDSDWSILYIHEKTGSYWEETFPNSELHGGGLPKFEKIELSEAIKNKYRLS